MKRLLRIILFTFILAGLLCFTCYFQVRNFARPYTTDDITTLPMRKTAVVLGTSAWVSRGKANPYFVNRMTAAAELYHRGKVEYILVSGDNRRADYNEPLQMRRALEREGVPANRIVLDYAGFRTLDSMIRAQKVFGQEEFIVISQEFHNQRAIYIARHHGIEAVGYNARDVKSPAYFKTPLREVLARVMMFIDLYILHTEPKFLGEEIIIG